MSTAEHAPAGHAHLGTALGVGLGLQVLFWGHRLLVLRTIAAWLGTASRWLEPHVGLLLPRVLFLLPGAMVVVLLPGVVRRRRGAEMALLVPAVLLAVLNVVTVVVLTRGA